MSMLLAEDDGELLGFSTCGESRDDDADPSVGEVRSFFVAAGRWGQGVGRELMAAALDSLRERGCAEATVWSFAANERANAFYERARLHARRCREDRGALGAPARGPLPP